MSLKCRLTGEVVTTVDCSHEAVRTKQEFKDFTDIRHIMRRYRQTGELTHVSKTLGQFGDFTNAPDFQTALQAVLNGRDAFDRLPADIRKRFDHNPVQFLQFCSDPANLAEAVELGLVTPPTPTEGEQMVEAISRVEDQLRQLGKGLAATEQVTS